MRVTGKELTPQPPPHTYHSSSYWSVWKHFMLRLNHLWERGDPPMKNGFSFFLFSPTLNNYSSKLWEGWRSKRCLIWCVFLFLPSLSAFANLFSCFFPQNTKQKFPIDMTYSSYPLPPLFPSLSLPTARLTQWVK